MVYLNYRVQEVPLVQLANQGPEAKRLHINANALHTQKEMFDQHESSYGFVFSD